MLMTKKEYVAYLICVERMSENQAYSLANKIFNLMR